MRAYRILPSRLFHFSKSTTTSYRILLQSLFYRVLLLNSLSMRRTIFHHGIWPDYRTLLSMVRLCIKDIMLEMFMDI